jgi:hypothetical protein
MTAFAEQLRAAADRMMTTGWPGLPGLPSSSSSSGSAPTTGPAAGTRATPVPLPPATASARQLGAVLADLESRRTQVRVLRDQLTSFDEQLATLEASLRPLHEWARTWAGVEDAATGGLWRETGKD